MTFWSSINSIIDEQKEGQEPIKSVQNLSCDNKQIYFLKGSETVYFLKGKMINIQRHCPN